MGTETVMRLAEEYGQLRSEMNADAWMYGTTTTKEFTDYRRPDLNSTAQMPEEDFAADTSASMYYVSLNTKGEIGWKSGTFNNRGLGESHVIEVLTASTPAPYKAYLRDRGVSYVIAGEDTLDCRVAMEKLYQLFHIEKLLICGGGMADWTFLSAGMIDELSLLLAPVTDGSQGKAALFSRMDDSDMGATVEFTLKEVRQTEGGGLYLRYQPENVVR